MADLYSPNVVPAEYDAEFFRQELERVAITVQELEPPWVILDPQDNEPSKIKAGMVVNADGTNWNPGYGAGLYLYIGSGWKPLFNLTSDSLTTEVQVDNTTTETEIFSADIDADHLKVGNIFKVILAGAYGVGIGTDNWTLRFKLNGTTIETVTRQSSNNVSDAGWVAEYKLAIAAEGASGTLKDVGILIDDDADYATGNKAGNTINTTVSNTFSVTVQWDAAKADNDFRLQLGYVEYIRP